MATNTGSEIIPKQEQLTQPASPEAQRAAQKEQMQQKLLEAVIAGDQEGINAFLEAPTAETLKAVKGFSDAAMKGESAQDQKEIEKIIAEVAAQVKDVTIFTTAKLKELSEKFQMHVEESSQELKPAPTVSIDSEPEEDLTPLTPQKMVSVGGDLEERPTVSEESRPAPVPEKTVEPPQNMMDAKYVEMSKKDLEEGLGGEPLAIELETKPGNVQDVKDRVLALRMAVGSMAGTERTRFAEWKKLQSEVKTLSDADRKLLADDLWVLERQMMGQSVELPQVTATVSESPEMAEAIQKSAEAAPEKTATPEKPKEASGAKAKSIEKSAAKTLEVDEDIFEEFDRMEGMESTKERVDPMQDYLNVHHSGLKRIELNIEKAIGAADLRSIGAEQVMLEKKYHEILRSLNERYVKLRAADSEMPGRDAQLARVAIEISAFKSRMLWMEARARAVEIELARRPKIEESEALVEKLHTEREAATEERKKQIDSEIDTQIKMTSPLIEAIDRVMEEVEGHEADMQDFAEKLGDVMEDENAWALDAHYDENGNFSYRDSWDKEYGGRENLQNEYERYMHGRKEAQQKGEKGGILDASVTSALSGDIDPLIKWLDSKEEKWKAFMGGKKNEGR